MSFTQGHALIIGVAEYQHAGRLNVPMVVNDVHATEQVIVDPRYCGYPASQVELVTDENATCAGTLAALDRLAGRAGEEDTVFLFYCGHGALGSDGEYYLVSHDAQIKDGRVTPGSGVSQAELLEKLRLIQARRALLVFNTCFSGKISPTLGPGGPEIESRSLPEDMTSALLATGGGRIIITACREEQSSYVGSGPLTIFTQAMVDGLRGKGVANNAGYISAYSLYEHIFTAVSEAVKEQENDLQEPELTVIKGVGPFAVALYKGASDRGEFDEGEPVPETFAVRQVKPEIANRSYNVIVKVCDGAVAIGKGAKAVGKGGVLIEGNVGGDVVTGLQIVLGLQKKSLPHPEALARYLENMIVTHQSLRLQGIRAGDQPLSVLVEKVYVSLSVLDKGLGAPIKGENKAKQDDALHGETGILSVGSALGHYKRLVIIGDPGSGKTTLLAYLALTYARTLANSADLVKNRLGLDEADSLPVLLPLRDLGRHLQEKHPDQGKDGPVLLLDYLREYYAAQAIDLKEDFFSHYLENGQAAVLLDGMDEVANLDLRQRVARLIEKFVLRFGKARYVVTSRVVGYEGPARIAADFGLAKVRDFTPQEVRRFVQDWTRVVETKLAGEETDDILRLASEQAGRLIFAIESTPRVAELAINPLLLTVIALVHRYRAELPERRSELYEEAVEVLLWHWDRAKGLGDEQDLGSIKLDSGDRRSLLEPVAFWMHERQRREIELPDLRNLLLPRFVNMAGDQARAEKAIENFLHVINERSGLLIERGLGVYGFAHLTFQEYLVARYLAGREDHLAYTLNVISDAWWREVILLQAGYLSSQGPGRVSGLIRAIMNADGVVA